ncbi:MAG: tetratricopeptide repeat protein [Planctomycetota bacterium]|jgi:tetratricopeptide (TPR) repeat protein
MTTKKRRWGLIVVALVLIAAMGAGAIYAVRRGREKKDLYARAISLLDEIKKIESKEQLDDADQTAIKERRSEAEKIFVTVLDVQPDHAHAYLKLSELLWDQGRTEEFFALCENWAQGDRLPELGWRAHVTGLIRVGKLEEAENLARLYVENDPLLYHRVILWTRNLSVEPRTRLVAVRAARNIADLEEDEFKRAQAFLDGAEILLDLDNKSADDQVRTSYRNLAMSMLDRALEACGRGKSDNMSQDWLGMVARINLWRGDENEVKAAVALLEDRLETPRPDMSDPRPAMIVYYVSKGALDKALELTLPLTEKPKTVFAPVRLRIIQAFARNGHRRVALDLLDKLFAKPWPAPAELLHLEILLTSEGSERELGLETARNLIRKASADPSVVRSVLAIAERAGARNSIPGLLELARSVNPDRRLDLLLVAALAGEDDRPTDRISALAERMGKAEYSLAESGSIMLVLDRIDPVVVSSYLDSRIKAGGEGKAEHLLLRARLNATRFLRSTTEGSDVKARGNAIADLRAIANLPDSSAAIASSSARIAFLLREHELAGRFISLDAGRRDSASVLPYVLAVTVTKGGVSEEIKKSLAAGMASAAAGMPAEPFLESLATWAVSEKPEWTDLAARMEPLTKEKRTAAQASFLAASASATLNKPDDAIKFARGLVDALPESSEARLLLASFLIRAGKAAEGAEFLEKQAEPTSAEFALRGAALLVLKRNDDALSVAREYLKKFPNDPRSSMLLARALHRKGDSESALAVLTSAPATRAITLARAAVLHERDRIAEALELYTKLLVNNAFDRQALDPRHGILMSKSRIDEAIQFLDRYIDYFEKKKLLDHPLRAHCLVLRGEALQRKGKVREALRDYEMANKDGGGGMVSYNNGAWLLAERAAHAAQSGSEDKESLATATAWADRAIELGANVANVWDTAAYVDFVAGRNDRALVRIDEALRIHDGASPDSTNPDYRLRRAEILHALGKQAEAVKELQLVEKNFPKTKAATSAIGLLKEYGAGG